MNERFDDLSRAMAGPTSRRGALKLLGATALAAAGAVVLRPFQGGAVTCPAGSPVCGQGCCPKGGTCTDPASSCCCPKGATPCGPMCCERGVACIDASQGQCGCPAGTTPCGSGANLTCCAAGQACGSGCPTAASLGTAAACVSGTTSTSTSSTSSTSTSTTLCIGSGAACVAGDTCCTAGEGCINDQCQPTTCGAFVAECTASSDCCSNFCFPLNGLCTSVVPGRTCTSKGQCGQGDCQNGVCCNPPGVGCNDDSDCCSGTCVNTICIAQ